jgi:hypothetical protein
MITQARLKELLRYNPKTGEFFWRVTVAQSVRIGNRAGCLNNDGHWKIRIEGKYYYASRLAWLFMYGYFPNGQLDHKNRNRSDNRISNLRQATHGQNMMNKKVYGRIGFKGVSQDRKIWRARLQIDGVTIRLGQFPTPEAAHAAYCEVAKKLHGEFFCSG